MPVKATQYMAKIFPFQPYRYSESAGPLDKLVTQPYDKISPEMRARYLSLSPHNLVRVILGERSPSDTDSDNVYTRAARYLEEWISTGVLQREKQPALFAYFQEFAVPDTGESLIRKGFIGLGHIYDYADNVVYRHEQTLSGPKKDRLELLRHTRAHAGQLFMLYPDRDQAIDRLLDEAAASAPGVSVTDEYGTIHRLWAVYDPARIAAIQELMEERRLLIADGHHRYETALAFRNEHPELEDASKVMMTFVNMYSPGLRILPTHRVLSNLKDFDAADFLAEVDKMFDARPLESLDGLRKEWAEPHPDRIRIGAIVEGVREPWLIEADREGELDVRFLHEEILNMLLAIGEDAVRDEKHIRYVRGAEAAVDMVRNGGAQVAFLLEAPSVEQVAEIAFSGGVMPQKSTDFYPKLLSGLTIYRIEK